MPVDDRDWKFPGPQATRLTQEEVMNCLGLKYARQLRRLIKEGRFPPPIKLFPKGPIYWLGSDVAWFQYAVTRGIQRTETVDGVADDPEDEEG